MASWDGPIGHPEVSRKDGGNSGVKKVVNQSVRGGREGEGT